MFYRLDGKQSPKSFQDLCFRPWGAAGSDAMAEAKPTIADEMLMEKRTGQNLRL
jgi:hypothetical protein